MEHMRFSACVRAAMRERLVMGKIGLPCFLYHFSLQCLHLNKVCLLCVHCDGKKLFATMSRGRMGERGGTVL